MNKRYLGAALMAPILVLLLLMGGEILRYGLMVTSLLGLKEFYNVGRKKTIKPFNLVGYLATIVYFVFLKETNFHNFSSMIIIAVMLLFTVPAVNPKYTYIDVMTTIFGFIYVTVFFSLIYLVSLKENGSYLIWIIFLSSWLCDTFAYYSGKFFGRRKLVPKVSPKKTVEGSIGGLIGSILGCILFGYILNYTIDLNIPIYHFASIGLLSGIFSQFGDLAASSIKRYSGVKDYSNLIPGHGGILDRFDSILFSAVVVFYYLTYLVKI